MLSLLRTPYLPSSSLLVQNFPTPLPVPPPPCKPRLSRAGQARPGQVRSGTRPAREDPEKKIHWVQALPGYLLNTTPTEYSEQSNPRRKTTEALDFASREYRKHNEAASELPHPGLSDTLLDTADRISAVLCLSLL